MESARNEHRLADLALVGALLDPHVVVSLLAISMLGLSAMITRLARAQLVPWHH